MRRSVLVYRAESGAQNILGLGPPVLGVTPPAQRRPFDSFTINESSTDKARKIASDWVQKRHGEAPESMHVLVDGSISVTLRAPRS